MNLCNCVKFDNPTLSFSLGTKFLISGIFSFCNIYYNIFKRILDQVEKILTKRKRFKVLIIYFFKTFFILLFQIYKLLYFLNDYMYFHCTNISENLNNNINLMLKTEKKNKKLIIWIIGMHCTIVLDFILP